MERFTVLPFNTFAHNYLQNETLMNLLEFVSFEYRLRNKQIPNIVKHTIEYFIQNPDSIQKWINKTLNGKSDNNKPKENIHKEDIYSIWSREFNSSKSCAQNPNSHP